MPGSQQGESSHSAANQVPSMYGNQEGQSLQFEANQTPSIHSSQQGESSQFGVNQAPNIYGNQQSELSLSSANQVPSIFGGQQGESSHSAANQAPLEAASAQGGQEGAEHSTAIESMMTVFKGLMAHCERIQTNLSSTVYRDLSIKYSTLVSRTRKELSQGPAPHPMQKTFILEACIRIESRLFQLMHRTLVADDVGNPVIGRLPAPPCQLECRNSVATAQQVVTLNQAFQLPCRGCVAEGIMCQRSFIDEACPPCAGRHLQCLTDYTTDESQMQTNTGPPPVIDGPVDPAANIRRMMENLFQEHHKVLIDMYRSKDAKDVMSLLDLQIELSSLRPALEGYNNVALWEFWIRNMRKVWLDCNLKESLAKTPTHLEIATQWAVRECVQGRLFILRSVARDSPDTFSGKFGPFGLCRHCIARNLFYLDTYWLEADCPEQRLEVRDTLVELLSFCNLIAGYICSGQSYLEFSHREFLRANPYMMSQQFAEI